ncbi:MAG: hypothetical protein N2559_07800 [Anaerolineae bacterium]|nr:hypothetical protein [Anaerolineae bacterium]
MGNQQTTFSDAIEQVMLANGYYASLQLIYKEFVKYRPLTGKTPLKTIQERVQRDRRFTRIGLGVYALTEHLDKLPLAPKPQTVVEQRNYMHTRIQGMLIEIGNMDGFKTFTPDKSKVFDNKRLGNLVSLQRIPPFTYPRIVRSVRYIDVIWFNEQGFPERAFEVEDSTDFRRSLVKFTDLQYFNMTFHLIASAERKDKFEREVVRAAFSGIAKRCHFVSYDEIIQLYDARLRYQKARASLPF